MLSKRSGELALHAVVFHVPLELTNRRYVVPDNATNLLSPAMAPAKMLKESLDRMGLESIDIYLVHGHIHASSIAQVAKGLAECVDSGMTKTVGVANYSTEDMLKMSDELAKYDIPLATNQCEYSVLRRHPEIHGLLQACKDKGIIFQSYSSLAQGRLTGKYSKENPPPKTHRFSSYPMEDVEHILNVLRDIGAKRGKPVAAVALNYNISKGVVPVVSSGRVALVYPVNWYCKADGAFRSACESRNRRRRLWKPLDGG